MPFSQLDASALGRSLAQIAEAPGDIVDLFLERKEEVEVATGRGVGGDDPGFVARREQGFAVRLVRDGSSWLAARDEFEQADFEDALREVARARPAMAYPGPKERGPVYSGPVVAPEVRAFPSQVERRIRAAHVAFPLLLTVQRCHRWVQVLGQRLVSEPEEELFYSARADFSWGRYGALLPDLTERSAEHLASCLIAHFRAREGAVAPTGRQPLLLGSDAAAVLLHEAVAHTLEADTLILTGRPEAACGFSLGSPLLDVLDDPGGAPTRVARGFDDEGVPVLRRWLLRGGEVKEPLADLRFAAGSERLAPGAGRRSDRHSMPVPRSTHLELLAGDTGESALFAAARGGLFLPEASSGSLDPIAGRFSLSFPYGRRIGPDGPADYVGPCRLRGRVSEILEAVAAVGDEPRFGGAGWCAKAGLRMPVWATCPPVLVDGLSVEVSG
ncbi:MAG: metallopeptidase TldD-related protein [Acidobacteriota bacterium]|nr:metallopeptidase TldD-related protein [Acidobacteriota bacterium]